jgi:signal peptidase II
LNNFAFVGIVTHHNLYSTFKPRKMPPTLKRLLRTSVILVVLSCNIGCDQISKNIVRQRVAYYEHISLVSNHFIITKVENTGAFLSVGDSLPQPFKSLLLIVLPLVALAFGLKYLMTGKNLSWTMVLGICFGIGGGLGNIYDRILHGSVTDFLHIDLGLFRTGIFNMADVSVMIGAALMLIDTYSKSHKQPANFEP